jgi:hypothetical protein
MPTSAQASEVVTSNNGTIFATKAGADHKQNLAEDNWVHGFGFWR